MQTNQNGWRETQKYNAHMYASNFRMVFFASIYIQLNHFTGMVSDYIEQLKSDGISIATRHNRLASIRRAMQALGKKSRKVGSLLKNNHEPRDDVAPKNHCQRPLLNGKESRNLGEQVLQTALNCSRLLGHRGLESLMSISARSFPLSKCHHPNKNALSVVRRRKTQIYTAHPCRSAETLQVIKEALFISDNMYLVSGNKTGLKSARAKYHYLAGRIGLVGKYSPHSLRYAYSVEKIHDLQKQSGQ
ncbi:MAG: integrase domain-containing protein [Burkholderiaceae bacterium]